MQPLSVCVCVCLSQMRSHVRMSEGRRNREKRPKMRLPWRKVCNICIYVCSGGGQRGRTHCGAAVRVITISHIVKCTNAWICFKGFMGSESVCVCMCKRICLRTNILGLVLMATTTPEWNSTAPSSSGRFSVLTGEGFCAKFVHAMMAMVRWCVCAASLRCTHI